MRRKSPTILLAILLITCVTSARAQQTPPVMPNIQETPLPPPVELAPPPTLPADVPQRPLTADEAARIALRNQPNVVAAQGAAEAAAGRTQQTRAALRPTVTGSAGYTHVESLATESSGGTSGGGGTGGTGGGGVVTTGGGGGVTVAGYSASAVLRQLIYDFNHTRDLVRQSAAEERAAGHAVTRVQADLVLQVKQAFYTSAQNERLVGVNAANVRNQQDHLALAQARLRSGLGLPIDVVRAQTGVSEAILELNVARNNASVARVNLALLMGVDPRTPIQIAESGEPAVTATDVNGLVQQALTQRPELQEAQALVQAAQRGVSAAKSTNAPSLGASLQLSSRGQDFPPGNDFLTLGAFITFSPFDGGLRSGRVKEARGNLTTVQAQLTSAQLSVTADVSQAYLNLRTAEQRVTTADSAVANAQESVRLAEGRYRSGVGTFIDVTDAQSALLTAQTNRVNAQSAVEQARAALARAVGTALPGAAP